MIRLTNMSGCPTAWPRNKDDGEDVQSGWKLDLPGGVAAAHDVLHIAEDNSCDFARPDVRNKGAISQDHHQSTFKHWVDIFRIFCSNNSKFGFANLQTNTQNKEHHQESDEESSNAYGDYFSDEGDDDFTAAMGDGQHKYMWNMERYDSDLEEEEDGHAVPKGAKGALSGDADSVASQPATHPAAHPAVQPVVKPDPGPVFTKDNDDCNLSITKGRSCTHLAMEAKKVVYLSFDIKTRGGGGIAASFKCQASWSYWIWKAQN